MSEIPDNPVTQEDLTLWYTLQEELARLRASEMLLRRKIFKFYFPAPEEGTNTFVLPDGYALKGTYKIDRKVDVAALTTLTPFMREKEIPVDTIFVMKPDLALREYRKIEKTDAQKIIDQCLIIKPSDSPGLEIVKPAK